MGTKPRVKPQRLAGKLRLIRDALEMSQSELLKHLGLEDSISYKKISDYERGQREPSLIVLLEYARVAGVCVDVLINDQLDLPAKLPAKAKHS